MGISSILQCLTLKGTTVKIFTNIILTLFQCLRFADKQMRLLRLKSLRRVVEDRCCEYLSKKQKIDDAVRNIYMLLFSTSFVS